MTPRRSTHRAPGPKAPRGITLIETVISMLLVTLTMTSTLAIVGPVVGSTHVAQDKLRATRLAAELMDEITSKAYTEPDLVSISVGLDLGESEKSRKTFDDVDDYDGWAASPPQLVDGTAHDFTRSWKRSVTVEYAQIGTGGIKGAASDTGFKRVRVEVSRDGILLCALESVVVPGDGDNDALIDLEINLGGVLGGL